MEGIGLVNMKIESTLHSFLTGLTQIKNKIINRFPDPVRKIYGLEN